MTKDKKIAFSVAAVFVVLSFPLWIWFVSNAVSGVLSLMLERQPTRSELIGAYGYVASWGSASLRLDSDGMFSEIVTAKKQAPRAYPGSWSGTEDQNSAKVTFRPFGMVWDEDHNSETNIFSMNFYRRRLGNTYAVVDSDLGEEFKRQ